MESSIPTIKPLPRKPGDEVVFRDQLFQPGPQVGTDRTHMGKKPGQHVKELQAARQASAPPPNVEPCMPGPSTAAAFSPQTTAPIGRPAASGLASVITSGTEPFVQSWKANAVPVRPIPHWISSKISRASFAVASFLASAANSAVIDTMPPSPRIGSRMIPAVFSPTASSRAAKSFGGTKRTPGINGAKGALYLGWPVTEIAPRVRPPTNPAGLRSRACSRRARGRVPWRS